jgi:heme/copper-type cytochrome/quinol oxidase subunit 3
VVFFGTLILTYLLFRLRDPVDFAAAKAHLSIPLIALNTFILILSSFMVVQALESIRNGRQVSMRNYLIAVMVLGALFLGGQAFEWTSLYKEGIWFSSPFGTPFFTITGIHGTHVLVGLIWCVYLLIGVFKGAYTRSKHLAIENFGLYWHFVDVVWIVLFTVFYLI